MENKLISQCCVCGSIKDDNGNYDGITRTVVREGNISHGYCPPCFKKAKEAMEKSLEKLGY